MKAFIQLRQQLGFCQEDMATAFGVSRPKLVRAEGHRGTLPTSAHHKLTQLEAYMSETGNTEDITVKNQQAKLLAILKNQRDNCVYKIKKLQRSIRQLEEAYRVAQNGLKVLAKMETGREEYPATYIPSTRTKLEEKLSKCSPVVTTPIKIKLEGLLVEEKYLVAEIAKMEKEEEILNQSKTEAVDQKTADQSNAEVVEEVAAPKQEEVIRSEAPGLFVIPYAVQRVAEDSQSFALDEQRYILKSSAPPQLYKYDTKIYVVEEAEINVPEKTSSGTG